MFKLEIDTDNAAFEEGCATELARILTNLAGLLTKTEPDMGSGGLRDANGNSVGSWDLS